MRVTIMRSILLMNNERKALGLKCALLLHVSLSHRPAKRAMILTRHVASSLSTSPPDLLPLPSYPP